MSFAVKHNDINCVYKIFFVLRKTDLVNIIDIKKKVKIKFI